MWSKQICLFVTKFVQVAFLISIIINYLSNYNLINAQFLIEDELNSPNQVLSVSSLNREQFVQFNQIKEDNQNNPNNQRTNQFSNQIPTNFTVELVNLNSVRLKWQPPISKENAVLQYKIKYEKLNSNKHNTITLDSKIQTYLFENLDSDSDYRFKICAVFVNDDGNLGPFTKWSKQIRTQKELDENRVPEKPEYLLAIGKSTRIHLKWSPPLNSSVKIREYLLNFGVNFPDINHLKIDTNQNEYIIKDLQPKQEYVISLRANNKFGAGPAVYATAKTTTKEDDDLIADELDEEEEEIPNNQEINDKEIDKTENETNKLNSISVPKLNSDSTDNVLNSLNNHETDPELLPPLGVKAEVLSSNKIRVSWTDEGKKDQSYMIKFNSLIDKTNKNKMKLLNTSDNHILIDDLKPFTKYEFAVKMIKRNRASTWSMSVVNTTSEALPAGAPRDLVVMPVSNLAITGTPNEALLTNKIITNDNSNQLEAEDSNKLTEIAYTGSGSFNKQATMKRAKSAISKTGKYRNKFKSSKNSYPEENEEEDELNKSPNSQNYVQESESDKQKIDFALDKTNDINSLFDRQAVPGLSAVSLSWQPAKQVNGEILGYLVSYNRNGTKEWYTHQVHGDQRSTVVRNLLPETVYYFKAQVRNKKGIGPYSSPVMFRTTPEPFYFIDNSSVSTNTLYVIIAIISSISLLLLIVISSLLCKSKKNHPNPIIGNNIYSNSPLSKRRTNTYMPHSPLSASNTLKLNKNCDYPQIDDLWINHDLIELNKLDKNQLNEEFSITATPILQRMETFLGRDGL